MYKTYLFRATVAIAALNIDVGDIVSVNGLDGTPAVWVTRENPLTAGMLLGAVADGLLAPVSDLPPHWDAALAAIHPPAAASLPAPPRTLRVLP